MSKMNQKDDSPVFSKLQLIANLMILNVLWLLCSLPIVTIGASTAALNYTCIKMRRDEGESIVRMFFHSFKTNIRPALILGTGFLAVLIILTAGFIQTLGAINAGKTVSVVFAVLIVVLLFCWLVYFTYVFMTLSRFDNTIFRTLTNSMYFALHNFISTLKILGIESFGLIIIPLFLWRFIPALFVIVLMIGVPVTAYIISKEFNDVIFAEYIPEPFDQAVPSQM
ncbi:YesL family protein [Lactimicrobium massiliense]|uniref:YesL family protein n=1 Tax=Lactimicrobium massiliense TaxID=2161814 RepID=UPI000D54D230|nr:YesL family protein [Lactimicrobium massiliense]